MNTETSPWPTRQTYRDSALSTTIRKVHSPLAANYPKTRKTITLQYSRRIGHSRWRCRTIQRRRQRGSESPFIRRYGETGCKCIHQEPEPRILFQAFPIQTLLVGQQRFIQNNENPTGRKTKSEQMGNPTACRSGKYKELHLSGQCQHTGKRQWRKCHRFQEQCSRKTALRQYTNIHSNVATKLKVGIFHLDGEVAYQNQVSKTFCPYRNCRLTATCTWNSVSPKSTPDRNGSRCALFQ